ncbi:tyrosine-protein phosphatase [Caulobacter mirabilis]|uniref:Protein tyrosine phosphatase n=1 Tax=Caulobacter mirabilis TaxID=69666 RepID=A0A2D2ASJ6_9CAUL|nr:tyrosine-protein phosphatase [Caulobacter mirabilis]ATQ40947.1 protein tyrosine phosphatase [Caulobacter mirabilis]
MTRKLAFDGIENFRDFGDYAAGSKRLKQGVLYRSAHQAEASDADLESMRALGLTVIVDLRRPNERRRSPSRRWQGFAAEVIENDVGDEHDDPWHDFLRTSDLSAQAFHDYMVDYYREAPFVGRHVDLYSRYFQALARTDGAVLIHCAAGKDRTGILAALTHHLAGVHEDDIVSDYLLTNDPQRFERRIPLMRAVIKENTGRETSDEALIAALGVETRYLETAFAAIHAEHPSLDDYMEKVLGVDAAARAVIEAKILA